MNKGSTPLVIFLLCISQQLNARSALRTIPEATPTIITRYQDKNTPSFTIKSPYLEEYPFFKIFNKKYFESHMLPDTPINYRYNKNKSVDGKELKSLMAIFIKEIQQQKKTYTDFTVLRQSNFNHKHCSGLLIAQCKRHPFVVKVFMETPQTFMKYKKKGIEPHVFFYLAGGVNRHLLGFTRVKNLENITSELKKHPEWADLITLPRKWFFLPQDAQWLEITGKYIGSKESQSITIPAIYCVVSDLIDATRKSSVINKSDRKQCMNLCNTLDFTIDPHIDNFLIEKSTGKLAIVDTEHFHSVVGLKKKRKFSSYFGWYRHLAAKITKTMFLRTKKDHALAQTEQSETELTYSE